MNRRGFLGMLAALPLVPKIVKEAIEKVELRDFSKDYKHVLHFSADEMNSERVTVYFNDVSNDLAVFLDDTSDNLGAKWYEDDEPMQIRTTLPKLVRRKL